ncbi:MAG: sunset domain-containing protein [Pseudonocardia sp.]
MSGVTWVLVVLAIVVLVAVVVAVSRRGGAGAEPAAELNPQPLPPAPAPPSDEATEPVLPVAADRGVATPPAVPALAALDDGLAGGVAATVGSGAAAAVAADVTEAGPYAGSVLPTADGSAPSGEYTIKANAGSRRYHAPESPYFHRNRADVWFGSAADAEAAGFVAWNGRPAAT